MVEYAQDMIKIKHPYIIQLFSIAILAFSIVFAGSSYNFVSAAEPGCYAVSNSVNSSSEVIKNTAKTTCPSSEQSRVDNDELCFVTSVGSSGQTDFVKTICDSINLGNTSVGDADNPDSSQSGGEFKISLNGEATLDNENYCGKGTKQVRISFDIGCLGNAYEGDELNPVLDMLFALLRFVSAGVGLIVIGSIIWAGIQYSTSRGNPQSTEASIKRVTNSVIALLLYIFSFAILNFLVPGGLFVG